MKLTKLKDHAVLRAPLAVVGGYMSKCDPSEPKNDPKATMKEDYAINVLLSLGEINTCIDQLYFSIGMLAGYKNQNTPDGMNRHDYIVFGIENYFLRLTSVYDRCLRLSNIVFQLGLPERECRENTVTSNLHIKRTPVAIALKNLEKFTSPFRAHRNTIAHQSTYSEKKLNKIGSYFLVSENDETFDDQKILRKFFKQETDQYVAGEKEKFQKYVKDIEGLVEAFYDAIHKIFETRLAKQ